MTGPVAVPKSPRRRRRSSFKRTATAVIITLSVVALLAVAFAVVHYFTSRTLFADYDGGKYYVKQRDGVYVLLDEDGALVRMNDEGDYYITDYGTLLMVDPETGAHSVVASVIPANGEDLEFKSYSGAFDVLMYPLIQRSEMRSIRVVNEKGDFTLAYDTDANDFKIVGYEGYEYDDVMFSSLVVATGYTNTYMRLDISKALDPNVDTTDENGYDKYQGFRQNGYAEYGLPDDPKDAKVYFEVTDKNGKVNKVIIGDKVPSGTGYYARHAERPEVYILKETDATTYSQPLSVVLFEGVERYVKPLVVFPMSSNSYFDVSNFTINHVGEITDEMLETLTPEEIAKQMLTSVIGFTYQPIELRRGTLYSSRPYVGVGKYENYNINSFNVDDCLQNLMDMEGERVVRIFKDEEADGAVFTFLRNYGISFCIEYVANIERDATTYEVKNSAFQRIWISNVSADGTYYVYNEAFQMIVEVDRAYMEYLEWSDIEWVEKDIFSGSSIAYLQKMVCTVPGYASIAGLDRAETVFQFNNSASVEGWKPSSQQPIPPTDLLTVHANGVAIDVEQVKSYYRMLLFSSLGGMVSEEECSAERQEAFREGREAPLLEVRLVYTTNVDGSGDVVTRVFRFFDYGNDMKCFVTLGSEGSFWMSRDRVEKMMRDLGYVFTGEEIVPEGVL